MKKPIQITLIFLFSLFVTATYAMPNTLKCPSVAIVKTGATALKIVHKNPITCKYRVHSETVYDQEVVPGKNFVLWRIVVRQIKANSVSEALSKAKSTASSVGYGDEFASHLIGSKIYTCAYLPGEVYAEGVWTER